MELRRARKQLAALTEQVEQNTRILKQSQRRELRMLRSADLAALFGEMTDGLRVSYQLQAATVMIADPDHDIRHLLIAGGRRPSEFPDLLLVDSLAGVAPQYIGFSQPWLGEYSACDHQLLLPNRDSIRSVAMIPLQHRGSSVGSLNFGSADVQRFTRTHATDFFTHLGVIASFALENAINRARLLRSGFTDVLTGANNRRYLQLRLAEEMSRARRDGNPVSALMIDADHFKRINDEYGHAAGDDVLRELAQRMEGQIRASDVMARFGGEEFVVLLPATSADEAATIAERIRCAIADEAVTLERGPDQSLTISIGVATVAVDKSQGELKPLGESLLARADVALYDAKNAGRNRVCSSPTSM